MWRLRRAQAPVNVSTMGDPGDGHLQGVVVDFVDDPVIALSHPVGSRPGSYQPPGLRWMRVVRKSRYPLLYPIPVPDG